MMKILYYPNKKLAEDFLANNIKFNYLLFPFIVGKKSTVFDKMEFARKRYPVKDIIFDTGIKYLERNEDYPHINDLHKLLQQNLLNQNEHLSIDYPPMIRPRFAEKFIKKTMENIHKYYDHPNYIITLHMIPGFENRLEYLVGTYNIFKYFVAFGGGIFVRNFNLEFEKYFQFLRRKVFDFIKQHPTQKIRLHFFGVGAAILNNLARFVYHPNILASFDSTKYLGDWIYQGWNLGKNEKSETYIFFRYIRNLSLDVIIT